MRNRTASRIAALVLPVAVAAGFVAGSVGCSSTAEQWQAMEAQYQVPFPVMWSAVKLTLVEQFDTIEYERSADGDLRTGWKEDLNYLVGYGLREQAHVQVRKGEKGWRVRVRVTRQENEEPIYTTDSSRARWAEADDNAARALHLVGLIHVKLRRATDDS